MQGKFVIVRTNNAGVHAGTVVSFDGKVITLTDSRRIYSWRGAMTLSEIANAGVGQGSKLAVAVTITLPEPIEIIECTEAAASNIRGFPAWT